MKTYTEQEIKAICTPDIIKKMVELSEGFEIKDDSDVICFYDYKCSIKTITESVILFPLLIHRAVGGWNKKCKPNHICFLTVQNNEIQLVRIGEGHTFYLFKDYLSQSLTACECAMLHCLLDIFKEEEK